MGFRRIEIKDSILRINGRRLVFKGVNRQDYCGETGRAVPLDKLRRDLMAMKRCNINALRTSCLLYTSRGAFPFGKAAPT